MFPSALSMIYEAVLYVGLYALCCFLPAPASLHNALSKRNCPQ